MSRKKVSKGQIILKKSEKIAKVLDILPEGHTNDAFVDTFIREFPDDWKRVEKRYQEHVELGKGKPFPMAQPRKYMVESLKAYQRKLARAVAENASEK